MPKTTRKTEKERRADALKRFIRAECAKTDLKNLAGLADALGVKYATFYYRLRSGTISALTVNNIIHALHMDDEAVRQLYKI
ncbi:MAG: hypothetical protein Q4C03_05110 [bacterium]|jgi:hypothetical protein|nr:hypothetical protein [bacterium]